MRKRRITLLLQSAVSLGLIALILFSVDLRATGAELRQTNLWLFAAGVALMNVNLLVRSYKWRLLLGVCGARVPLLTLFKLNYMGAFFSSFFLGSLGGDAFRAYNTRAWTRSVGGSTAPVLMERVTGVFAAIILVMALAVVLPFGSEDLISWPLVAMFAGLGLATCLALLALSSDRSLSIQNFLFRRCRRARDFAKELGTSLQLYRSYFPVLCWAVLAAVLSCFIRSASVYLFILSVHPPVAYLDVLFVSIAVGLLVMIPVSLNGIGIQEASYFFYLAKIGVSDPETVVVGILARAGVVVLSLTGGLVYLFWKAPLDGSKENRTQSRVDVAGAAVRPQM
jgi:glycosyltransferase 2 family protein